MLAKVYKNDSDIRQIDAATAKCHKFHVSAGRMATEASYSRVPASCSKKNDSAAKAWKS